MSSTGRNRYLDVTLESLSTACTKAAGHLQDHPEGPLSAAVRERLRLLLIACSMRLSPTEVWGTRPAEHRNRRDFFPSLQADHARRLAEARYRTVSIAANETLGEAGFRWVVETRIDGAAACDLAVSSEEGLAAVLAMLESVASARRRS